MALYKHGKDLKFGQGRRKKYFPRSKYNLYDLLISKFVKIVTNIFLVLLVVNRIFRI